MARIRVWGNVVGCVAVLAVVGGCGSDNGGATASKEAYCAVAKEVETAGSQDGSLEESITAIVAGIQKARDVAPSEIESDVAVVAAGAEKIGAAWAANDYDSAKTAADPAYIAATEDQAYNTAHDNVDAYNTKECSLTTGWP